MLMMIFIIHIFRALHYTQGTACLDIGTTDFL